MVAIGTHIQCEICGTVWFQNRAVHGEPKYCPKCGKQEHRVLADQAVRFSEPVEHPSALVYRARTERSFLEQLVHATREPTSKHRCAMLGWGATFWRRAVTAAILDSPYGPSEPCPVCDGIHRLTRQEFLWLNRRRTKYLQTCRSDPNAPSRRDVGLVCQWIIRWGYRPANFWLHYADLPIPADGEFRSEITDHVEGP